jgi:proline racemase
MDQRLARLREEHDWLRSVVVNEPRGFAALVGALLLKSSDPSCEGGVIFFNNVGYLGMCGHGLIGVVASLAHLGQIEPGQHHFDTSVGRVSATLGERGTVSFDNVPAHRLATGVSVNVPGVGDVTGDVAYGGNWFFLTNDHGQEVKRDNVDGLVQVAREIRKAVNAQGHPEVDHIELFAPSESPGANARNFVLCPGGVYDRSPCGTGTSAKLACLAVAGALAEGECWVQEGILGSQFEGRYRWLERDQGTIIPTITGTAHVTAESTLLLDERDPFRWGIQ